MASLLTIPLELLIAVSEYLPTEDLGSLRLACKQTEKSLYEWFSKEFFFKKQFMLTYKSLQALIDISKHVSLSKKVSHIIIATNVYGEIPLRFKDKDAATRYIQGYEDQKTLLSTGIDREMLTEAFERLENLTTIGIRDFNAGNRVRDGKSWSSWGATTVHRETGIELRFSDRDSFAHELGTRFASRVFYSVLYALGKANRRPTEFEILLRERGLPDTAFFLPDYIRPTVEPTLQNTTTLLLNVDLKPRYLHTHSNGTSADPNAGRSLRRFLHFTPNLVHLRLNFEKHLIANNEDFLQWLGMPEPAAGGSSTTFLNPASITLPLLKKLELGQLSARAEILVAVVTKFAPTLEDLSLWRMNLPAVTVAPFGHKPNFWRDFFHKLSKVQKLALNHLRVGLLQQDHMHVGFRQEDANGELKTPTKTVKEHMGADMGKFWKELEEEVTVKWPEETILIDASDEDEDEVMGDEDDEDDEDGDDSDGSDE
ncbi:hypothetical protein G6011_05114 [Alternaria panax]|uniref:F-box domain-containing protein n=1 Tax=Alternaria panax TaxID=48097 RepID=A0AAD4I684_9PLEO|nr:hypothetical protein G6011_05114 [Alternaria panax]